MAAIAEEVGVRNRKLLATMKSRQRMNTLVFLGPAMALIAFFLVAPVVLDLVMAFTNIGRDLQITDFTMRNFDRAFTGDSRLSNVLLRTAIYVGGTLLIFNTTFGLILALTTTALPKASGGFFRSVWLVPRMSPSVVYIVLWKWSVHSGDSSLVNQILMNVFGFKEPVDLLVNAPMGLIIIANGFIGASFALIILTATIRSIPEHLFHAAKVDGATSMSIVRHVVMPALRWPLTYITIWQTLSLVVSFEYILLLTEGGPFQDTTVFALYIYRRAFAGGQYGYGAALSLFLIVPGIFFALFVWRASRMRELMQQPRIEVH